MVLANNTHDKNDSNENGTNHQNGTNSDTDIDHDLLPEKDGGRILQDRRKYILNP